MVNWDGVCVCRNFAQNWDKFATELLLEYRSNAPIVEDSRKDDFWRCEAY